MIDECLKIDNCFIEKIRQPICSHGDSSQNKNSKALSSTISYHCKHESESRIRLFKTLFIFFTLKEVQLTLHWHLNETTSRERMRRQRIFKARNQPQQRAREERLCIPEFVVQSGCELCKWERRHLSTRQWSFQFEKYFRWYFESLEKLRKAFLIGKLYLLWRKKISTHTNLITLFNLRSVRTEKKWLMAKCILDGWFVIELKVGDHK